VPVLRRAAGGDRPFLRTAERSAELNELPGRPPTHAGFDAELRIDWLAATELAGELTGRLGLTHLPGKRGASVRYPGHVYRRSTADDLATMRAAGIGLLVLLVEDRELERWGDPRIGELAVAGGVALARFPIPDGEAAASVAQMDEIQALIDTARRQDDVAVACMGGVGRTGMVAACALVRAGMAADTAIDRVRQLRHPTAVETAAQEEFVRRYAAPR
jgi:protein-tyrosine phosphatase